MSYIAAVGAKDRVSKYLDNSFDPGMTVGKGMTANASNYIADTKYGAQSDYYSDVGQAQLKGIGKAGAAAVGAQQDAQFGGIMGSIGGALNPMAGTIREQGLFGFPKLGQ